VCGEHQVKIDQGGDQQNGEGQTVVPAYAEHSGNNKRAEHGARLAKRLVQAEDLAVAAESLARMGEHHVARRVPWGSALARDATRSASGMK